MKDTGKKFDKFEAAVYAVGSIIALAVMVMINFM